MPRPPRLIVPDVAVHIRHRGNDRQDCFRDDKDRLVYLAVLHELSRTLGCALHAYCLMTNHVHLLVTPADKTGCSTLMRDLGQRYVQYFNRRHCRTGTLWEGRYRSCLVDSREYVLSCYRYIEMNPVRAAMVRRAGDYRWSSHAGNSGAASNALIRPHCEYLALAHDPSARQAAYLRLFETADDAAFATAIRAATNGGYALIGEELERKLTENGGRRLSPGKPGRPAVDATRPDDLSLELGL
jgi:putative transposase